MTWHSLPVFVRLQGRPVILLGEGEAAEAKRRLLERAGANVVADHPHARLAVVAVEDEEQAGAAVERLRARGVLVNAVDRPALCDFTLPAIVDRDPVLVAVGTGGVSAGLAAALRQRLEAMIPAGLGRVAEALFAGRERLRAMFPDAAARRRALAGAMVAGGELDPLGGVAPFLTGLPMADALDLVLGAVTAGQQLGDGIRSFPLRSRDPDDLTIGQARLLAMADRVYHGADVPPAILVRARADAPRIVSAEPPVSPGPGLTIYVRMASMEPAA